MRQVGLSTMSGRPRLAIGTYGTITTTELPGGQWDAKTRYRDHDGKTRQLRARGTTAAKAKAALKLKIRDRQHAVGHDNLDADSTVAQLADRWMLDDVERGLGRGGKPRTANTVAYYRRVVDKIIKPGLSDVTLREADTQRVDRFLLALPALSARRDARVVLRQAFALAARYGCISVNPVIDAHRPPASLAKPRALGVADVHELRQRIRKWQAEELRGPRRAHDLVEIFDVMLGTGVRIEEVLALRWSDCTDLDADRVAVTISGTVVTEKGRGCYRQDHPKTDAGLRTVILPKFAVEALRRQRDRGIPSAEGLIFPTRTGSPRWPSNVRTAWRKVRGEEYGWVKPHSFRKTVGTLVARELGVEAASVQLGHSATAVTERHYIERAVEAPDMTSVLDRLA